MEALHSLLQQVMRMQWSDYLDILVVAFIIYRLLPLIRTPSTMRVARAVIVVVVIAAMTDVMHLYTLSFLINQFLSIGLLALVVLFRSCGGCWTIWEASAWGLCSAGSSRWRRWIWSSARPWRLATA